MKKIIFSAVAMLAISVGYAQSSAGLIAHWNMDSSTNDVSGGGHHGHGNNVVPAAGSDGIMGHAYYFNGTNSSITAPYSPLYNVTKYSVCAIVKADDFYSGTCQHNIIFTRGKTGTGTGNFCLSMLDDNDCVNFNPATECFVSQAEARITTGAPYFYTPAIAVGTWYKVVATFNDSAYKVYVNGALVKTTNITPVGAALGASTDSISMGMNIFEAAYPYNFKGTIDDVRFYDRPLTDSEAVHYNDTCGRITSEPVSVYAGVGSVCHFVVHSSFVNPVYQWQHNAGSGFANIATGAPYSGINTDSLVISGVTSAITGTTYRCIISNSWGCSDTTSTDTVFAGVGVADVISADKIAVIPNPAGNTVAIQMPYTGGEGSVQLINTIGQVVVSKSILETTTQFNLTGLPAGIYTAVIRYNGQTAYKKIQKL